MIPLGVLASTRSAPAGLTLTHRGTWPVESDASLTAVPIGDASAARTVLVVATWASNLVRSILDVTIGGVTAALDLDDTTNRAGVAVWRATVPTGTSADVVLTWNTGFPSTVAVLTAPAALTVVDAVASPVAVGAVTSTITSATAAGGVVVAGAASGEAGIVTLSPSGTSIIAADNQAASTYATTGAPLTITSTVDVAATNTARNPFAAVAYKGA